MRLSPVRIFVVDDQTIFRESVIAVLSLQEDFEVVGHAGTISEAKPLIPNSNLDVLLLDTELAEQSGLDLLREMRQLSPLCKTIMIAGTEKDDEVVQAMRLGARGFLIKHCPTELFLKCIRKVHAGEIWLDGRMTEAVLAALSGKQVESAPTTTADLSRREMEVIELVVQGYKNRDIARKLFISEKTVKNHLSAIFNKLGVADRLELTLYVFEKKLFPNIPE